MLGNTPLSSASISSPYFDDASGVLIGGASIIVCVYSTTASGGIWANGGTNALGTYNVVIASAGVLIGGTWIVEQTGTHDFISDGVGIWANGTSGIFDIHSNFIASGGTWANGTAPRSHIASTVVASGGMYGNGSGIIGCRFKPQIASAGTWVNGTADTTATTYNFTVTPAGILIGGTWIVEQTGTHDFVSDGVGTWANGTANYMSLKLPPLIPAGAVGGWLDFVPIMLDTFTDADFMPLQTHVADIDPGYTLFIGTGSPFILGNKATWNGNNGFVATFMHNDSATVQVTINFNGGVTDASITFRRFDGNNGWFFTLSNHDQQVQLYQTVAGVTTQIAFSTFHTDTSSDYIVQAIFADNNFSFYVNGSIVMTYSDTSYIYESATGVGFGQGSSGTSSDWKVLFDNFKVLPIQPPNTVQETIIPSVSPAGVMANGFIITDFGYISPGPGVLAAGHASFTDNYKLTGGVIYGAGTANNLLISSPVIASAGVKANGTAIVGSVHLEVGSSGAKANGTANAAASYAIIPTAGVWANGTATLLIVHNHTPSAGAWANGISDSTEVYNSLMLSGGAFISGHGALIFDNTGSGGAYANGSSSIAVFYATVGSSGLWTNGNAVQFAIHNPDLPQGSVYASGISEVEAAYSAIPTGLALVSGHGALIFDDTTSGGAEVNGYFIADVFDMTTSGGVIAGSQIIVSSDHVFATVSCTAPELKCGWSTQDQFCAAAIAVQGFGSKFSNTQRRDITATSITSNAMPTYGGTAIVPAITFCRQSLRVTAQNMPPAGFFAPAPTNPNWPDTSGNQPLPMLSRKGNRALLERRGC